MKRLLKVTVMTGMLTLLKMAIGFVIAKVIAVYTGPAGMAMLGQVQSLIGGINGIVTAPVGSGVVRFTAEHSKRDISECIPWWRASLQWTLILLAIIIPLGLLLSQEVSLWLLHRNDFAWVIILIISALPLSIIGTLFNSVINGQQQYKRYIILGMISSLVSGGIMLAMIFIANIQGALIAATLQSALIGLVMLIMNIRQPWCRLHYWFGKTNRSARNDISGYMIMAITSAAIVPISIISVRTILIDSLGWSAAGEWQAVWKISEVYLSVITIALGTYYLPRLSSLSDKILIISEIQQTARVIIPIVSLMAVIIYCLRDVVISVLFTPEFQGARDLFFAQFSGDVVKIASWIYAYPMLSKGKVKWFVCTEVTFSFLFVVFSYIFIPIFDVNGVSIAYLFNYMLCFFYIKLNYKRFLK